MSSSSVNGGSGISLPAPLVRVRLQPHTEAGMDGSTFRLRNVVEVAAADYSEECEDLRIELLRRRKGKPIYNRGFQWVHPHDATFSANGGSSRGGDQTTDGGAVIARSTSFPVAGEYDWVNVPLGTWWKSGSIDAFDENGNVTSTLDTPVTTGSRSSSRGQPPACVPPWNSVGGVIKARFAFRLSCIDPDGLDINDRLTGPISAARVVMRPIVNYEAPGLHVWPDGLGGAVGTDTDYIGTWLEDIS